MTNMTITLDANAFMTLEEDGYDPALNEVLRRGLDGYYTVAVTAELKAELARDTNDQRRIRNLQKLEKFPEIEIPGEAEISMFAQQLIDVLFPNATPTTGAYIRQRSDCQHIAIHLLSKRNYFITADQDLLHHLNRLPSQWQVQASTAAAFLQDIFYPSIEPSLKALVLPRLSIRRATQEDKPAVLQLLSHLEDHYPGFAGWLDRQFHSPQDVIIKLAIANEETIAGISIGKQKEPGVWKLATFYIDPKYQRNGLGQHLLFNEVQSWLDNRVSKVVVTTGVDNTSIIEFLRQVGFVVEGVAPERYPRQVEIVLGRHLVPQTFTPSTFPALAEVLARRLLGAQVVNSTASEVRCESLLHELPLYMTSPHGEIILRCLTPTTQQFIVEIEIDGLVRERMDAWDLETRFHPLTLTWPGREAFVIPIYEQYADALFEMHRPQTQFLSEPVTKRLLQMDNVYYCHPRYTEVIRRGTPILFYVTKGRNMGGGVAGSIVGMALVQEMQVASPDVLYLEHGQRGVYDLQAITRHTNSQGRAMAIHFSWLRPLPDLISYQTIKAKLPQWNPQTLQAINHSNFLELCQIGGLYLGDAKPT